MNRKVTLLENRIHLLKMLPFAEMKVISPAA